MRDRQVTRRDLPAAKPLLAAMLAVMALALFGDHAALRRVDAAPERVPAGWMPRPSIDFLRDVFSEIGTAETRTSRLASVDDEARTLRSTIGEGEERATAPDRMAGQAISALSRDARRTRYPERQASDPGGIDPILATMIVAALGLGLVAASTRLTARGKDRRMQERRRVSQPGRIVARTLRAPLPCTILDLSLGGARVGLVEPAELPPCFELVFLQTGATHRVRVRWRDDLQVGVQFVD